MKVSAILSLIVLTASIYSCQKDQPESAFTTEKEVYKEKESVQFENTSLNGVTYYWNFGDGESSLLKNPGHTYTESGQYIVTLQVQGAKKTTPAEFSKTITIVGENSNITGPDLIFANSTWIADSLTQHYHFCGGEMHDNSTNTVHQSMTFYENNTVLMLFSGTGNLCEYEILNDTLIGFFEDPYYRTWSFSVSDDRLTLTNNSITSCPSGDPGEVQGYLNQQHFYRD